MIIKKATEAEEFLGIHRLNYRTFVEEIPQHPANSEKILIDKFHDTNHYIIAKEKDELLGMVSYNHHRPFSLDSKVENLDSYLPQNSKLAEIRLLAIIPEKRSGTLAYKLLHYLFDVVFALGTDAAIISGSTRQLKLYSHIGFKPFGPLVGSPGAEFQPMYITLKEISSDFTH
jgi:hypothetical protein